MASSITSHPARVIRAFAAQGATHSTVQALWRQLTRMQQAENPRLLKWARDERHATVLCHRLPVRLRRHVCIESWDD